jgi:DNA mismatch endonuclease (patch repair protein)
VNTRPELIVRSLLHRSGYRFRLHKKNLPGKPDIVLPKYKSVIFVNGCFWHSHGCKDSGTPKSNTGTWRKKLEDTVLRDTRNYSQLEQAGWRVLVVWECELRDKEALCGRFERFFHDVPVTEVLQ